MCVQRTEAGIVLQPQRRKGGGRRAELSLLFQEVEVEVEVKLLSFRV